MRTLAIFFLMLLSGVAMYSQNTPARTAIAPSPVPTKSSFPQGGDKWNEYIKKKTLHIAMRAPQSVSGRYTVQVNMVVGPDGTLIPYSVSSNPSNSYLEKKCREVIANAPKWIPAMVDGRTVEDERVDFFFFNIRRIIN